MGLICRRDGAEHKSKTFACPSWSWASQESGVSYYLVSRVLKEASHQALMKDAGSCEHSSDDRRSSDDEDFSQGKSFEQSYCEKLSTNTSNNDEVARPVPRIIEVSWNVDPTNPFGNISNTYIELHTTMGVGIVLYDQFERRAYYKTQGDDSQALMIPYIKKRGMGDWWYAEATIDNPSNGGSCCNSTPTGVGVDNTVIASAASSRP